MENLLPATIPSYALANANLDSIFDEVMGGLSLGRNPMIKAKQGKFRLVDRDGVETVIKPNELRDGEFLPVVILRAKQALSKTYYIKAYDPNVEATPPDCFSEDAITPDASIAQPMAKACATCPMNAFGSGRNANGQPTEGKACSDTKILAVFYKGGIYEFRVNPSSLRNIAAYFGALRERKVSPGAVLTYIGLDDSTEFTKFTFRAGAFIPEDAIPQLAEKSESGECLAIIQPKTRAPKAQPAPAAAAAPAPAAAAPVTVVDPLEGLGVPAAAAAPAKPKAVPKPKPAAQPAVEAEPETGGLNDGDIADILNL